MTRKDFQLIADVLVESMGGDDWDDSREDTRRSIAERFADRLATTNERFDRGRFLAACGVTS